MLLSQFKCETAYSQLIGYCFFHFREFSHRNVDAFHLPLAIYFDFVTVVVDDALALPKSIHQPAATLNYRRLVYTFVYWSNRRINISLIPIAVVYTKSFY